MTAQEYKVIRQQLGTQAEVARRLGVARSTVAHRESGKMTMTPEAALSLSALTHTKNNPTKKTPMKNQESETSDGDAMDNVTTISVAAMERIMACGCGFRSEVWGLYFFYRHVAKQQEVKAFKCTDQYMMKACGIGRVRFLRAKAVLKKLNLI